MGKFNKGKAKKVVQEKEPDVEQSNGDLSSILARMDQKKKTKKKNMKRTVEEAIPSSSNVEAPKKKKKKQQQAEVSPETKELVKQKKKKVPEPEPEEDDEEVEEVEAEEDSVIDEEEENLDDEEDEDEEESDEEDEEDESDAELMNDDGTGENLDFDFEAFPMEEGDRDGIENMLTQIFLRADVGTRGIAEALIAQSPIGNVIGPAESCADDESENVVYGIISTINIDGAKAKDTAGMNDVIHLISQRAKKQAQKQIYSKFEDTLKSKFGWLINERMLRFPSQIAPPMFASLQQDLSSMKSVPEQFLYIQKLRVADPDPEEKPAAPAPKKKLGKAAKKRLVAEKLAASTVIFDNEEDALLLELPQGEAVYFDYPVEGEVEAGSKFHIQIKGGKKFHPFRRAVIMDRARLDAFVEAVKNF